MYPIEFDDLVEKVQQTEIGQSIAIVAPLIEPCCWGDHKQQGIILGYLGKKPEEYDPDAMITVCGKDPENGSVVQIACDAMLVQPRVHCRLADIVDYHRTEVRSLEDGSQI